MCAKSNYTRKEYPVSVCAYMAGILDGEGSLTIGNYSCSKKTGDKHYQVNIAISSVDKVLIDWLHDTFGGYRGKYTPRQTPKNSRRQVHVWQCSGDRLLHICEITLPYLVIKKKEAEILIKMRKTYQDLQYIKGDGMNKRLPQEILDYRLSLFTELRAMHQRAYPYRDNLSLAPCCPPENQ